MCSLYSIGEENWILTANELSSTWNVDIIHASNGIECTVCLTCDGPSATSCCVFVSRNGTSLSARMCAQRHRAHAYAHSRENERQRFFFRFFSGHSRIVKHLLLHWKFLKQTQRVALYWASMVQGVNRSPNHLQFITHKFQVSQSVLSTTNFATKVLEFKEYLNKCLNDPPAIYS